MREKIKQQTHHRNVINNTIKKQSRTIRKLTKQLYDAQNNDGIGGDRNPPGKEDHRNKKKY